MTASDPSTLQARASTREVSPTATTLPPLRPGAGTRLGPELLARLAKLSRNNAPGTASRDQLKDVLRRYYQMWEGRSRIRADEVCAGNYHDHMPHAGPAGPAGVQAAVDMFRKGFPDATCTVEFMIAEGDMVAGHSTLRGTHKGEFLGIPPTGRRVEMHTLDIVRIEYGQIAEIWHIEAKQKLLYQIGAVAHPDAVESLVQLMNSVQEVAAMRAALDLDLFQHVGEGGTAAAIAERATCPERSTRMLLDGLCEMGLVHRTGGNYALSAVARTYLVPGTSHYLGGMAAILCDPVHWEGYNRLTDAVRHDGSMLAHHAEKPHHSFWVTFARSSDSLAHKVGSQMEADLRSFIRSKEKVRVLDVGAGSGAYAYLLAKAHPNVEVTVLDWPNVVPEMQRTAREMEVDRERVTFIGGDMMRVDYQGPYDIVLVGHVYHHIDRYDCAKLTDRISRAMAPGARLLLHEFITKPDDPWGALFNITMLAWTKQGDTYQISDYREWFEESGLKLVGVTPNAGLKSVIIVGEKQT